MNTKRNYEHVKYVKTVEPEITEETVETVESVETVETAEVEVEVENIELSPTKQTEVTKTPSKKMRAKLIELIGKLVELNQNVRALKADKTCSAEHKQWIDQVSKLIRSIEVCAKKDLKPKIAGQKKNIAQSGITKPEMITEEMSSFAGWPVGELRSRVDVSIAILKYVKENSLQNPAKKTEIIPDEKLKTLLKYDRELHGPLLYISIQKLLSNVIIKKMKIETSPQE